MSVVRIFISSPSDVADERLQARQVIGQLQRQYGAAAQLLPVFWEDLPLQVNASFQEGIDTVLSEKHRIDIAVFILWSRLGSVLGGAVRKADGSPYRSGTEREFEMMLAAHHQGENGRPHILAYVRDDDDGFKKKLHDSPADELENLVAQRGLVRHFIREQFHDDEGRNLRAFHTYLSPPSFAKRLGVHLRDLCDDLLGDEAGQKTLHWAGEPYRGLEFFDVEHADIFQGREEEVFALEEILRRRASDPADGRAGVVVVGASGSGKSSLVRAGLAASLTRLNLDETVREWRHAVLLPGAAGGSLPQALVHCLASALPTLGEAGVRPDDLAGALADNPDTAIRLSIDPAFARESQRAGGPVRLLLVVDQMEELWTDQRITAEGRERFLEILGTLCGAGSVAVAATLRSDFYPLAHLSPAFLRLKGALGQYDLPPPATAAVQSMIAEPARLAGLRFEKNEKTRQRLDERLVEDALRQPDALPLLQYTLRELHRQRNASGLLTFAAYDGLGGVEGAVGRRAQETFGALPTEAQAAFAEVMQHLVTVNVDGAARPLRLRVALARATDTTAKKAFTEAFVAERFFTAGQEGGEAVVSIAHEALLRRWERLADWVGANQDALRRRARVEQSRSRWEQAKDSSLLLPPGLPLEEGRELLKTTPGLLAADIRDYIDASVRFHATAETRRKRRRNLAMAALTALTLLALAGGGLAWQARRTAEQQRARAEEALRASEALTRQLRANSDDLAENTISLAFGVLAQSSDGNIRSLAISFLVNTRKTFDLRYDADSIGHSFHAAVLCQQISFALVLSRPSVETNAVQGRNLSDEDRKFVEEAAAYTAKETEIFSRLLTEPGFDRFLADKGLDRADYRQLMSESLISTGTFAWFRRDYPASIATFLKVVSDAEAYEPKNDDQRANRANSLYQTCTNLSHVYRLQGDHPNARDAMAKALWYGEIVAGVKPEVRKILLIRYLIADRFGELDDEQKRTLDEHRRTWGFDRENLAVLDQVVEQLVGAKQSP